jgi:complement component 1 Q subcomponent-binding protein, mitochondrial
MLSARILARSAPRVAQRITSNPSTVLSRRAASQLCAPTTSFRHPRSVLSQLASRHPVPQLTATRAFSLSAARRAGETDDELIAKVESELAYEDDVKDDTPMPTSIRDFLDNSPFTLEDTPGQQDVKLVREFGNEK